MKAWIKEQYGRRLNMPILSFPAVGPLGIDVKKLVSSAACQTAAMTEIAKLPVSAVLGLMDLSVEAEAFGAAVRFFHNEVPAVAAPLVMNENEARMLNVPVPGGGRDGIYIKGIADAVKNIIDRPVFAGVIGPFSLVGRLMDLTEAIVNCYEDSAFIHIMLEKASAYIGGYIKAFKQAGAKGVIMAEPAAGLLSPDLCRKCSSAYIKRIFAETNADDFILIYHNCGNVLPLADSIIDIGADAYHFGNHVKLTDMLNIMPSDKLVMGNIDPTLFVRGTEAEIKINVFELLEAGCSYRNFCLSSGCDIPPAAIWDNIKAYFSAVHDFYMTRAG